ncbi:MAG: hypothetical protein ACI9MC_000434 [Kiritimatiellia bacterium]|jgi:hypothetical protein
MAGDPIEVGTNFTDDFEFRWWRVDEKYQRLRDITDRDIYNYLEQVNRFTASVNAGNYSAFAQVDEVSLYLNRYDLDGKVLNERNLLDPDGGLRSPMPGSSFATVEKLSFGYANGDIKVKLGDFYATFGQGGVLGIDRLVDIDVDTSIQGALVQYSPDDWTITALAGHLNRQQVYQDNPNVLIYGDLRHKVAGVRVENSGIGPATVGLHSTAVAYATDTGLAASFKCRTGVEGCGFAPDVVTGGVTVDIMTGPIDWATELDVYHFPKASHAAWEIWSFDEPEKLGMAAYGTASLLAGPVALLFEGKRYKNTERMDSPVESELYQIVNLPTLEYEVAVNKDTASAMASNDIYGGTARADFLVSDAVTPYVWTMISRDRDTGGSHVNHVPETIYHTMVGAEVIAGESALLLNVGYRLDDRDGTFYTQDQQVYGDLQLKVGFGHEMQISPQLALESFKWGNAVEEGGDPSQQPHDFVEIESGLTFSKGSSFAVTWFTDYTTNDLVIEQGNLSEPLFGALEVQVKPNSAWTLKGFFGAYKSGIRCSGGQCRVLPGFNGARFSAVGTF